MKSDRHDQRISEELKPYLVTEPVFYEPTCVKNGFLSHDSEVEIYLAAKRIVNPRTNQPMPLPVMLKGPTGSAKTTFLESCAYRREVALVTAPGQEDLCADDLIGYSRLEGDTSIWVPGRAYIAAKEEPGATLYLDEIVEVRPDVTTIVHPLTDYRRRLEAPANHETVIAQPNFSVDASYNPGYQSVKKDLKMSLRQRFICLPIGYPNDIKDEVSILESLLRGSDGSSASVPRELKPYNVRKEDIKAVAELTRKIRGLSQGPTAKLREGPSPRLEFYALLLMKEGVHSRDACLVSLCYPLIDDPDTTNTIRSMVHQAF